MAEDYSCFFCDSYRDHAVLHETESFYIYLEEFKTLIPCQVKKNSVKKQAKTGEKGFSDHLS
ncbi:MAG: hypothetical protein ABEJ93_04480 [Candidatus Nanohalobium sp.]